MFFSAIWDPRFIVYQIVAVQSLYYAQLGVTLLLLNQFAGHIFSVEQIFNYRMTNTHSSNGWVVVMSVILNAFSGAVSLVFIVERSKKCLDHAVTVTILHCLVCTFYAGFPSSGSWWLVNVLGCVLMALVGEYLCMKRELREIPITTKGFGASPLSPPPQPTVSSRWIKESDDGSSSSSPRLMDSAGGFGGVLGVSGMPLGDFVGIPVQTSGEMEFTPRFGSGSGGGGEMEFTPRFGSGLGFSSSYAVYPSAPLSDSNVIISENAGSSPP